MKRENLLKLVSTGCAVLVAGGCHSGAGEGAEAPQSAHDMLIQNSRIVDGTGDEAYTADLLIKDGRIVEIGNIDAESIAASRRIDAAGRVLAPGFIDTHAHGDPVTDSYEVFLAMGVTTIVLGQDGGTAGVVPDSESNDYPKGLSDWIAEAESVGVEVNVAPMAGHGTIRWQAGAGVKSGRLSDRELDRMRAQLREDMEAGAFGMSSGLEYVPGLYSEPAELLALAKVVGHYEGVVMSHMRSEDDDRIESSIAELAAQGAYARVHISHLKIVYGKGEDRAAELLAHIEAVREGGVELSADIYPYTAGYASIALLFPEWALPPSDYDEIVENRREELAAWLEARMNKRNGPDALLLASPPYNGQTLKEAAEAAGKSFVDVLVEIGPHGAVGAHFTQDRATHDALVVSPLTAISTDGGPNLRHPRSSGTYARLIARYVREDSSLGLEEAVRKATFLPASIMGLHDRGVIREGAKADLVIFDPAQVQERSDYLDPLASARGFDVVIVNGAVAYADGELLPGRHGQVLARQ